MYIYIYVCENTWLCVKTLRFYLIALLRIYLSLLCSLQEITLQPCPLGDETIDNMRDVLSMQEVINFKKVWPFD